MARRILLIAATLPLTLLPACQQLTDVLPDITGWTRHTIDDGRRGADGVKLGDVNADGLFDLVVGWEESGQVVVYLNPGPALATMRWPAVVVGEVSNVEDAVFVDLDSDGQLDVVSCTEGGTETVYVHWAPADEQDLLEAGAWQTVALSATVGVQDWMFCAPTQLDGGGAPELLLAGKGSGAEIGYLIAAGNARSPDAWTWVPLADAAWVMSIIPADVDSDGDVDIVYTDRKGSGRGAWWLENVALGGALSTWSRHRIVGTTAEAMFLDLGDTDGNGRFDAFIATDERAVIHCRAPIDPRLPWAASPIEWSDSYGTGKAVRVADLQGDGEIELVFTCENATDRFGVGRLTQSTVAGVSLWSASPIGTTTGSKYDLIQLLDLDADGDLDILTTEESAGLGVTWYATP